MVSNTHPRTRTHALSFQLLESTSLSSHWFQIHNPIHTRTHTPPYATEEDERERIQKAGGFVQEGRVNGSLALSRAIGDLEYKQGSMSPADQIVTAYPELMECRLVEGDEFMVIACDGIWVGRRASSTLA